MSFGIQFAGRPAAVVDAVTNAPSYGDTSQVEVVKNLIEAAPGEA